MQGQAIDARAGVSSPPDFWDTAPFWPTVTKAWLEGADAGWLAQTYGLFEGNLMRGLLKVANLVNEWIAMATFCGDVDMLEKMREVPTLLLRGIAQPESLYLLL
jgi:superfamily II RNA helicase